MYAVSTTAAEGAVFGNCAETVGVTPESSDFLGKPRGADRACMIRMQNNLQKLHWDLTEKIIGVYHQAHYEFGDGFLEKLCQRVMVIALREAGLNVQEQVPIVVKFRGHTIGECIFDIVVNGLVIVEVKSGARLEPRHRAQIMNYLRASTFEVGLMFNFGPTREFDRVIYTNDRKITLAEADALRTTDK